MCLHSGRGRVIAYIEIKMMWRCCFRDGAQVVKVWNCPSRCSPALFTLTPPSAIGIFAQNQWGALSARCLKKDDKNSIETTQQHIEIKHTSSSSYH
jgi:hypothetical protein